MKGGLVVAYFWAQGLNAIKADLAPNFHGGYSEWLDLSKW